MLAPTSLAIGRLTSQQCLAHCRSSLPLSLQRVAILYRLSAPIARQYATQPVSRPKAHTGRATSTRKPRAAAKPTEAAATTSKASSSKAKPKTAGKPKAKPKAKTKAKSKGKTKATRKTKAKAKPKKKTRKPLTDKQKTAAAAKKTKDEVKALKAKLLKPPHRLPAIAYQVLLLEHSKGTKGLVGGATGMAKEMSAQYKALSTEQREHYNHIANENKAKNDIQYRQWIESHSPAAVHESNRARALLLKRAEQAGSKVHYPKLKDDRDVKGAMSAYTYFYVDRFKSGDFSGIPVVEAAKRIGEEWRALPAGQKKPYQDRQASDMARYAQEIKSVYNRDVKHTRAKVAPAT